VLTRKAQTLPMNIWAKSILGIAKINARQIQAALGTLLVRQACRKASVSIVCIGQNQASPSAHRIGCQLIASLRIWKHAMDKHQPQHRQTQQWRQPQHRQTQQWRQPQHHAHTQIWGKPSALMNLEKKRPLNGRVIPVNQVVSSNVRKVPSAMGIR